MNRERNENDSEELFQYQLFHPCFYRCAFVFIRFFDVMKRVGFVNFFFFFASISSLLVACNPTSRMAATLSDVETYINDRPDSALAVLEGVDSTALTTRALRARYSLLHVMALDKCYKDITVPGLLDEAAGWYERHGTADEKMKALYYQGRIAQDSKDQNGAAVYYARAEEYVDRVTDRHALGVLYLAEATVYNSVHNIEKEKEYTEKGLSVFQAINDPMKDLALGQLAIAYLSLKDWAVADSLFRKGLAASSSNPHAQAVFLSNYAHMKVLQPEPEPEAAIALLDRKQKELELGLSLQDAGAYAYALLLSGKEKEAKEIISQLEKQVKVSPLAVESWLSLCAMAAGDYRQAYEASSRVRILEDSTIQRTLTDSVIDAISSYREMSARQARLQYRINIAALLIILLVLCLALALAHIRKNKLEADKAQIMEVCSILEKEATEHERQTADLQKQLYNLRETARKERVLRFRQTGRLQAAIWHLNRQGGSWVSKDDHILAVKRELCQIYDIEDSGEKLIRRLDRDLDGKIMPLVEKLHLKGNSDEQLFLCCCLLDLPAEMVATRLKLTCNHVRVKKSRLKDQIEKLNNADYDVLFDIRRKNHYTSA